MTIFIMIHVAISLLAIFSGFIILGGLLAGKRFEAWTALFLTTTVLTSLTGFFLPSHHLMPSHIVGIISLVALVVAIYARYGRQLAGGWRILYVVFALLALYLNVFVGIVQNFMKIKALKNLAPTQTEPPFKLTQATVLMIFIVLGVIAARKFQNRPADLAQ